MLDRLAQELTLRDSQTDSSGSPKLHVSLCNTERPEQQWCFRKAFSCFHETQFKVHFRRPKDGKT